MTHPLLAAGRRTGNRKCYLLVRPTNLAAELKAAYDRGRAEGYNHGYVDGGISSAEVFVYGARPL